MLKINLSTDSGMTSLQAMKMAAAVVKQFNQSEENCVLLSGVECLANPFFLLMYDQLTLAGIPAYVENSGMLMDDSMIEAFREFMNFSETEELAEEHTGEIEETAEETEKTEGTEKTEETEENILEKILEEYSTELRKAC